MAQYKGAASEGTRAMHIQKKREKEKEQLELLKAKIVNVSRSCQTTSLHCIFDMVIFRKMPSNRIFTTNFRHIMMLWKRS